LGAALAALNQLEDTPTVRRSKLMSTSPMLRLKKEALDTVDRHQVPTPEVERNILGNDFAATVPLCR
jgi:hypothetical protein